MPHSRKELQEVSSRVYPDLERVPGKQNWVDKTGGLPSYIERIAKHLHYEKGRPIGTAIATAVATTKRWCSTGKNWNGGDLKPTTRAKACKAVASWEAKRAKSKAKTAAKSLKESAEMEEARDLVEAKGALPCDDMVAKEIAGLVKKRLMVAEGMLPALTEPKTVGKASLVKAANELLESELSDPVQLAMIGGPAADPRDMKRVAGKLQREVSDLRALAESLDGEENPPWQQENPKGDKGKKLTPEQKARAKRRAKKAGRKYPNLVDNMAAAKEMAEGMGGYIKKGDSGEQVKEVQQQVEGMQSYIGDAGADGNFGPQTERGVKAVQRREGLKADGMVGPKTKAMLDEKVPPSEIKAETQPEPQPEAQRSVEVPDWESAGSGLSRLRKPKAMVEADVAGSGTAEAATDGNVVAAPAGPPNLRESRGGDMNCGTCEYYEDGKCVKHGSHPVKPGQVCDDWQAEGAEMAEGMKVEVEVKIEKGESEEPEDEGYEGEGEGEGEDCGCDKGDHAYCPNCGMTHGESKCGCGYEWDGDEKYCPECGSPNKPILAILDEPVEMVQEATLDNRLRSAAASSLKRLRGDNRSILRKIYRMPDGTFAPRGMGQVLYPNDDVTLGGVKGRVTPDGNAVTLANGKKVKLNQAAQGSKSRITPADEAMASQYDAEGIPVDAEDPDPVPPVKVPGMPSPGQPERGDDATGTSGVDMRDPSNIALISTPEIDAIERVQAYRPMTDEEERKVWELKQAEWKRQGLDKPGRGMASPGYVKGGPDRTVEDYPVGSVASFDYPFGNDQVAKVTGEVVDHQSGKVYIKNPNYGTTTVSPDRVIGGLDKDNSIYQAPAGAELAFGDEVWRKVDRGWIKTGGQPGSPALSDVEMYEKFQNDPNYSGAKDVGMASPATLSPPWSPADFGGWRRKKAASDDRGQVATFGLKSGLTLSFDRDKGWLYSGPLTAEQVGGLTREGDWKSFEGSGYSGLTSSDGGQIISFDSGETQANGISISDDDAREIAANKRNNNAFVGGGMASPSRNDIMRLGADLEMGDQVRTGMDKDGGTYGKVTGFTDNGDVEVTNSDGSTTTVGRLTTIQTLPEGNRTPGMRSMKATPEQVERVKGRIQRVLDKQTEIGNLEEIKEAYRTGNIPNNWEGQDLDMRWRWDLFHAALSPGNDPEDAAGEGEEIRRDLRDSGLKDAHTDTMLRKIVPPLTPDKGMKSPGQRPVMLAPDGDDMAESYVVDGDEIRKPLGTGTIQIDPDNPEAAFAEVRADMEAQQFWPDIYQINERGDVDLISAEDGSVIDVEWAEDRDDPAWLRQEYSGEAIVKAEADYDPSDEDGIAPGVEWDELEGWQVEELVSDAWLSLRPEARDAFRSKFDTAGLSDLRLLSDEGMASPGQAARDFYGPEWDDLPQDTRRRVISGVDLLRQGAPSEGMKSPFGGERGIYASVPLESGGEAALWTNWGNNSDQGYWGDLQRGGWRGGPPETQEEAILLIVDRLEADAEASREEYGNDLEGETWQGDGIRLDGLYDNGLLDPFFEDEQLTKLRDDTPEPVKRLVSDAADGVKFYPEEIDSIVEDLRPLYDPIEDKDGLRLAITKREIDSQLSQKASVLSELGLTQDDLDAASAAIVPLPTYRQWSANPDREGAIGDHDKKWALTALGQQPNPRQPQYVSQVQRSARLAADALAETNPELAAKFDEIATRYERAQRSANAQYRAQAEMKVTGGMMSPGKKGSALFSDVTPESYRASQKGGDPIEIENNIDKIARNIAAEYRALEAGGDPIEIENNIDKILRNRGFRSPGLLSSLLGPDPRENKPRLTDPTPYDSEPRNLPGSPARLPDGSLRDVTDLAPEQLGKLFYRQRMWNARMLMNGTDDPNAYFHLENEIRRRQRSLDALDPMQTTTQMLYPERYELAGMASPARPINAKAGDKVRLRPEAVGLAKTLDMDFGGDAIVIAPASGAGMVTVQRVSDGKVIQVNQAALMPSGGGIASPLTQADVLALIDDPDPAFDLEVIEVRDSMLDVRHGNERFLVSGPPESIALAAERLNGNPTDLDTPVKVKVSEAESRGMQSPAAFARTARRVAQGETVYFNHGTVITAGDDGPRITHGYATAPVASPELTPDAQARVTTYTAQALDAASAALVDYFAQGETEEVFAKFADGDATDLLALTNLEPELVRGGMASPKVAPNPTPLPDSYSDNDEAVELQDMPMGTMFADVGGYTYVLHKVAGGKGEFYIAKPVDAEGNIIKEDPHPNAALNKKGHGPTRRILFWRYAPKSIGGIHPDYTDDEAEAPSAPAMADAPEAPTASEVATEQTGAVLDGMAAYQAGSPARSGKGNIRNLKAMKNEKFLGLYDEMQSWATLDPKGFEAVNEEMGRRIGLPADDDKHIPEIVAAPAVGPTPTEAIVPPPAVIEEIPEVEATPEVTPTTIDPTMSPARSGKGNVRNISAMSDDKLLTTIYEMSQDAGDGKPWALHDKKAWAKISEVAEERGISIPTEADLTPSPVTTAALTGNGGLVDAMNNGETPEPDPDPIYNAVKDAVENQPTEYISVTDTAKLIRKDLKEAFPGVKFSVRSKKYAGGASIHVSYEDGPLEKEVEAVIGKYQGSTFDPMIDLKSSVTGELDGKPVHFGSDYVFAHRELSDGFKEELKAEIEAATGETLTLASKDENGKWIEGSEHQIRIHPLDGEVISGTTQNGYPDSADSLVQQLSRWRSKSDTPSKPKEPEFKAEANPSVEEKDAIYDAIKASVGNKGAFMRSQVHSDQVHVPEANDPVLDNEAVKSAVAEVAQANSVPDGLYGDAGMSALAQLDGADWDVRALEDLDTETVQRFFQYAENWNYHSLNAPFAAELKKRGADWYPPESGDGAPAPDGTEPPVYDEAPGYTDFENGVPIEAMPYTQYPPVAFKDAQQGDTILIPDYDLEYGPNRRVVKSVKVDGDKATIEFYPDEGEDPIVKTYDANGNTELIHRQGYIWKEGVVPTAMGENLGGLVNGETGERLDTKKGATPDPKMAEIASELGDWQPAEVQSALAELANKGVVIDTEEESAATIATVLKATGAMPAGMKSPAIDKDGTLMPSNPSEATVMPEQDMSVIDPARFDWRGDGGPYGVDVGPRGKVPSGDDAYLGVYTHDNGAKEAVLLVQQGTEGSPDWRLATLDELNYTQIAELSRAELLSRLGLEDSDLSDSELRDRLRAKRA